MTPQALYDHPTKYVTHVLDDLHGFKFDHVHEADLAWWNMNTNERVTVRTIEDHVHSCGRRIWRLATVWLDERPVMVIQNAGREGDDHVKRFITDSMAFLEMFIYLRSLARQDVPDCNAVAAAEEIEGLDAFYGHKLGESWA